MAVLKCTCENEWQDKEYGSKQRVHNLCGMEKTSMSSYCCTVCGNKRMKSETPDRVRK
jgi:hypothetical protein